MRARPVSGSVGPVISTTTSAGPAQTQDRPGPVVAVIAMLVALSCLGFAVVNIVFEATAHFAAGPYSEYAAGFAVMNWIVVGLKAVGAAVAILSVVQRPRLVSPAVMTVLLWGAFATLGVYALGSVGEAVGMATSVAGSPDQIDIAGIGYVTYFLAMATGYGVLTISYSRRHGLRKRLAALGVLGAPALLGSLLLVIPTMLAPLGLLPAP